LPAHVEVIEPEEFILDSHELSSVLTELTVKLHKFDEIAKVLTMERNNLIQRLNALESRIKSPGMVPSSHIPVRVDQKDSTNKVKKNSKKKK
jgi:hypothetical protein